MMRLIIPTLAFVVLSAAVPAAAETVVLAPDGSVSTVNSLVHVVGRSDASVVTLYLNGIPWGTAETDDSIFHARIHLPYGLNQIDVVPEREASSDSTVKELPPSDMVSFEILCGPRISRNYQRAYPSYEFHTDTDRPLCTDCHGMGEGTDGVAEDASWCYGCHPDIEERFVSHGTDDDLVCTNCHRMNVDLSRQQTGVYTDMNPCYLCHKDKIGEFAQDFIHGPVAGGTCTVCHNPHGSEFEGNLISPVPVLCIFCHTSIDESEFPVRHEPFSSGRCVDCHDPHATGNRWVLSKDSGALCVECHEEDIVPSNHRHPVDAKPRKKLVEGLTLDESGRMECLTCHQAHGSSTDFLLRSEGPHACLGCHPEYQ